MQAVPSTKDTKKVNNRKNHSRLSLQLHPNHLPYSPTLSTPLKKKEEKEKEDKNIFQMTNMGLFFAKTKHQSLQYPSCFSLIKEGSFVSYNNVTLEDLKHPSFPVLSYKIKEIIDFTTKIIKTNSYANNLYPQSAWKSLITLIAQQYNPVSYHNFSHAFNLMLINYQCIQRQEALKKLYTQEEIFYILIAGISHDIAHRGTNNQFQIKNKTDLARTSKNESVLQNMHIRTLWKILAHNKHINFLSKAKDQQKARHTITRLILNTDMAFHFTNIDRLKCLKNSNSLVLNADSDHKWFIMEQVFHACDVGNPCLEYDTYLSWAALLSFEFDEQARLQEQMGVEVTRAFVYKDISTLYADQQWFLGSIVQPLWKELSLIFPTLSIFHENVTTNLLRIKEQMGQKNIQ